MKKYFLCGLAVLALTGCSSGVSQSDYESVSAELQTAEAEKESLQTELESVRSDLDAKSSENESLSEGLSNLEKDYQAYQESMAPYESLSQLEANLKRQSLNLLRLPVKRQSRNPLRNLNLLPLLSLWKLKKLDMIPALLMISLQGTPTKTKERK